MNKQFQETGGAPRSDGDYSLVAAPANQPATPQHSEPTTGGSYLRDPATGAISKTAGPVPADQPDQE